jgi:hypothetical protein
MKISFDFDSTLSRKDVQSFVKELIAVGHEVWIVTSRGSTGPALEKGWWWVEKQNADLFAVAESVGIPKERIVFTEHADKIEFLEGKGFVVHVDDDPDELWAIVRSGDACGVVNVEHSDWMLHFSEICSI